MMPRPFLRLSDSTPRIGIVSAFGAEADLLVEQTGRRQVWTVNGNRFVTGHLAGNEVVIVLCGVGMVNAAMVTQCMLNHFDIRALVMSGIAGGVDPECHVGDVLVPSHWVAPMEIYWSGSGEIPAPCGRPGDLGPLGLRLARNGSDQPFEEFRVAAGSQQVSTGMFLRDTWVTHEQAAPEGEFRFDFPVDARMLALARGLQPRLRTVGPRQADLAVGTQPRLRVGGAGASCGAFLANPAYRAYLQKTLAVRVIDMETAALAQVAYANRVPFIGFRSLSDTAGGGDAHEVGAFFGSGLAETNASEVTLCFLQAWADQASVALA